MAHAVVVTINIYEFRDDTKTRLLIRGTNKHQKEYVDIDKKEHVKLKKNILFAPDYYALIIDGQVIPLRREKACNQFQF